MTSPASALRVSDADRSAVADRLAAALGDGRLTVAEYDERLRGAYQARTSGELVPLTADLPAAAPPAPPAPTAAARVRSGWEPWRQAIAANLFFVAIWAWSSIWSGHLVFFWPLFLILLSAVGAGAFSLRRR